jgi:hypothetical protein
MPIVREKKVNTTSGLLKNCDIRTRGTYFLIIITVQKMELGRQKEYFV